jgi:hypothetical protein
MSPKAQQPPEPVVEQYFWKPGSRVPVPAEDAWTEFQAQRKAFGVVTPERTVERAEAVDHPLHPVFDWDDATAAHAHRLAQAQHIIRSFVVVYRRPGKPKELTPPMRYLVRVTPGPKDEQASDAEHLAMQPRNYIPVGEAMADADLRRRVLLQALKDFVALRQKYRDFQELAQVFTAIDAAQHTLTPAAKASA